MEHPPTPVPIEADIKIQGLKNPQYLVLCGFSTTLILRQLLAANKEISFVLIYEPNIGVFHATLQREWCGDLLDDKRIDFLIGTPPEGVVAQLYQVFTRSDPKLGSRAIRCQHPEIILDPFVYTEDKKEDGKKAIQAILDGAKQAFLAMGCTADSFYRWERMIQNEKNIARGKSVNGIYDKFKGETAIILGGGPSVQGFIDNYKSMNLGETSVIIACDAVLPLLIKNNIKPHIVTRCERKLSKIFGDVTREQTKGVYLAAYPWIAPEFYELFDDVINVFRTNGVCTWSGWDVGNVDGGVSSANAALEMAYRLGCRNIVMAGIDLCFIDNKTHVEGTQVEFDPEKSKAKWKTIKGNSGDVTSIPVWMRCLHEYEGTIDKHGEGTMVYNTSLNGAAITGTILKPWSELGPAFQKQVYATKKLDKHLQPTTFKVEGVKDFTENKAKLAENLKKTLEDLEKTMINVKDQYLLAGREEEKILYQTAGIFDPTEYFHQVKQTLKNLANSYQECCRQVDAFKARHYNNPLFRFCLLDIAQLSYFTTENMVGALINTVDHEHERLKTYTKYNSMFWGELQWLMKRLIDLMENGANQGTDLDGFTMRQKFEDIEATLELPVLGRAAE